MSSLLNLIMNLQATTQTDDVDQLDERLVYQLGVVIGASLPVTVNNDSANATYQSEHYPMVRRLVNDINELFILDIDGICETVKDVFIMRFNIVNHPEKAVALFTQHLQTKHELTHPDIFRGSEFTNLESSLTQYLKSLSVADDAQDEE